MAYAPSSTGAKRRGAASFPSGGKGPGNFASKAGSFGSKSQPSGGLKAKGMTTKGNAKRG